MKHLRNSLLLLFILATLISCSPGHLGGNEIAFIRNGHLWTIDPDGSNAFDVVNDTTPVLDYSWSPDHHIFVFRSLDADVAQTAAGKKFPVNPLTQEPGDLPSMINTVGIDGGTPIPTMFSSQDIRFSSPMWNTDGTHLLYRQEGLTTNNPLDVVWLVSQNDQPGGIATQTLPRSYSIPSLSEQNTTIGNSQNGVFTTTLAGKGLHYVLPTPLPTHPLPASLERILWQPAHHTPAILYAVATSSPSSNSGNPQTVQLLLRSADNHATLLTTCACTQFSWSPDGNTILYTTGTSYTLLNIHSMTSFSITTDAQSIPYWSPDSQFIIFDGLHTLSLVSLATQQQQVLLSDTSTGNRPARSPSIIGVNALLHPIGNSIWASDSRHFLFLTRNRSFWQGKQLAARQGLYSVSIDARGQVGQPALVDTGNDTQAGWSYENANTSFLFS